MLSSDELFCCNFNNAFNLLFIRFNLFELDDNGETRWSMFSLFTTETFWLKVPFVLLELLFNLSVALDILISRLNQGRTWSLLITRKEFVTGAWACCCSSSCRRAHSHLIWFLNCSIRRKIWIFNSFTNKTTTSFFVHILVVSKFKLFIQYSI